MAKMKVEELEIVEEGAFEEAPPERFLAESELEEFREYIAGEIQAQLEGESRAARLEQLIKWRRQRLARPETLTKDYPFPKSTNLAPPLTQSKVNTVYAKALAGFSLKRPFWDVQTNDPGLERASKALANLLNAYAKDPFSLNFKPVLRKALYESTSLGDQFYEGLWTHDVVSVADGAQRLVRQGPEVRLYRVEDFLTNPVWTDLQKAPWLAFRNDVTWGEVLKMLETGRYDRDEVEQMKAFNTTERDEAREASQGLMGVDALPSSGADVTKTYSLWRFYAWWLKDDKAIDLTGVIELNSKRILRLEPNDLGWRVVGRIGYFETDEIYSVGVCHQTEYLQEEAELWHNLAGDGAKWSMLGMLKARKDAGIRKEETIYPGKIWMLDNLDDVKEMRFEFDISPALAQENIVMKYADLATGANQALSGQADTTLKSGGGAMAQQILAQSASTIMDASFETMDEHFAEMGKLLAILVSKNWEHVDFDRLLSTEDAEILRGFFGTFGVQDLVTSFRFSVQTTDIQRAEGTKKETLALFSQLYSGYVQEIMGLMGQKMQLEAQAGPAAMPMIEFMKKAIAGKTDLMRQVANFMHVGIDPEKYFPEEIEDDQEAGGALQPTAGAMEARPADFMAAGGPMPASGAGMPPEFAAMGLGEPAPEA